MLKAALSSQDSVFLPVCLRTHHSSSWISVDMHAVAFAVFLLHVWTSVTGYPTGATVGRCGDMTPRHNVSPQSSPSPYSIVLSNTTFSTNQEIRVMIQGPEYLGLLLQARSGSNTDAVGTWGPPPSNTRYLACSGVNQSAITHSNRNSKNNETTYIWIAPDSLTTSFITATVVANRTTFWVNLVSETLSRVPDPNPGGTNNTAADLRMNFKPVVFLILLTSAAFQ